MFQLEPVDCDLSALQSGGRDLIRLRVNSEYQRAIREDADERTAMVLGANGFIGAHLVQALARHSQISRVICLVRPGKDQAPRDRVLRTLTTYGLTLTEDELDKCRFTGGQYTDFQLGLTDAGYAELANTVDVIYHVAGATDYATRYEELRKEYVHSLLQLLELCGIGRAKQLHYLSSTIRLMFQSPDDFQIHSWWYSGYARMKWVNSEILIRARTEFGVQAFVYDAPYVLGSTTRGQDPGLVYSFWRAVIACSLLGQIWDGGFMQFVPVDLLCRAFIANTFRRHPQGVVTPTIGTLWNRDVAVELGCELMDPADFFSHAQNAVVPKRRRMFEGVSYDDILKAACPDRIGDVIGPDDLPSPADVFLRGFRQPSVQAAMQAARSH